MKSLENRLPPPFIMFTIGAAMVLLNWLFPRDNADIYAFWQAAAVFSILGVGVCLAGVLGFRAAQTTMNPFQPDSATSLVTTGIYNYSRNPMYLGFALILIGLFILLNNQWFIAGPILFVLYMNQFQIAPEERAMEKLFGEEYITYCNKVRRWV